MEQLNKVELKGIVGSVRIQTYEESRMARIGLATNYAYKDREGTAVIDTSWHNVIAWEGRNIQGLEKIGKGTKLHVIGRLRYQNYTGVDGIDRVGTDILANQVQIIDDPSQMSYEMSDSSVRSTGPGRFLPHSCGPVPDFAPSLPACRLLPGRSGRAGAVAAVGAPGPRGRGPEPGGLYLPGHAQC